MTSSSVPKPQASPKLMVPRHSSETRRPLGPNSWYRIVPILSARTLG